MKLSLLLAIGLFSASIAHAQEAPESPQQHQLGVNATSFISNFLSFNNASPNVTPLSFIYKKGSEKSAFRLLVGLGGSNVETDQVGSDFTEKNSSFEAFLRSGKEWRFNLGERWVPYLGVDGFTSMERTIFETTSTFDNFKNTDQTIRAGAGAVLGIQFQISEHISLLTESYLDLFASYALNKSEGAFTDFKSQSTGYGFATSLPTNIYFVVSF